jgi:hypothetical protein
MLIFPLRVILGDFSVFLFADYKNVAKNVPIPIIFFGKQHLWGGKNKKMHNNSHRYKSESDKVSAIS